MLVTLLLWLYTFLVLTGWGLLFASLLRRLLHAPDACPLSLPILALTGFAAATTVASLISLFAPTGLLTFAVLSLGAAAGLYRYLRGRSLKQWLRGWLEAFSPRAVPPLVLMLAAVAFIYTLNAATLKTANPDTGIYHAQAVHWIESYPAVPGLGNLHTRLAYNSAWFVTNAAFSLAFLGVRSFHLVSGLFFLAVLAYFLGGANDLLRGRISPAVLLKTILFPLSTYLLARDISSPAPDLPAALLVWVCVVLYIEIVTTSRDAGAPDLRLDDAALAFLALFAVTVKLSTLPVLLLPLIRLFGRGRRFAFVLAGLAVVVLLPWLARNLILSGYPVFPGPALDLFHFDWRIPAQTVREESEGITLWARLPRLPAAEVREMPLRTWAKLWFLDMTPNRQLGILAALFSPVAMLLSLLAGLAARRRSAELLRTAVQVFPVWAVSWVGVLFWFFSAPAMRFGYGFLNAAALLAGLPLLQVGARWLLPRARPLALVLVVVLLIYQGGVLLQSLDAPTLAGRLVLPTDYTNLPTEPCRTDSLSMTCPSQWQECGYAAFPCTPNLNPRVVPRGPSPRDGYRSLDVP